MSIIMPGITRGQSVYVCDNGGFEDGYTHYSGATALWVHGSDECNPINQYIGVDNIPVDIPITWTVTNPLEEIIRQFEIVTVGTDVPTGFQRVKKGNSSLKLNHLLGHDTQNDCRDSELNKVVKTFEVDPDNRIFTVWYSVVFEFDDDHLANSLPFFNIKCNLAPNSELSFDMEDLIDRINYTHFCIDQGEGQGIVASNWACHTIIIPEEEVGNNATLEIIAADCGCNIHFTYAYIDAICEPCDSSSLGSGKFQDFNNGLGITKTCSGDTIELCGTYYLPTVGTGYTLSSFDVPGVTAYNKTINSTNQTFCFKIEKSDFEDPLCKDVYAVLNFTNSSGTLPPVISKPHTICYGDFASPELDIVVGSCNRNNPTDNYISDDYYYVDIEIMDASYVPWVITRTLHNPYQGESGTYQIKSGTGNGTHFLGPFLIQEGIWRLIFEYNNCVDTFLIEPPDYCSVCTELSNIKITNVKCNGNNQWSYDIEVSYSNAQIDDDFVIGNTHYSLNEPHQISSGPIGTACREVTIGYYQASTNSVICEAKINICPPQKCNNIQCDIKAIFNNIECVNNDTEFNLDIDVLNATCYKFKYGNGAYSSGDLITNPLGPFSNDVTLMFYSCSNPTSCACSISGCYKLLYVHKPDDCESRDFGGTEERINSQSSRFLEIFPNPLNQDYLIIKSSNNDVDFSIFNVNGYKIQSGKLKKGENSLFIDYPSGVYYISYKNIQDNIQSIKFIKL